MLYGVFLTYYEKYKESSIREFKTLLREVDENHQLILVNNNFFGPDRNSQSIEIPGDNTNWEFSGWDKGFEEIGDIKSNDTFIICNDTFCHHNEWNDRIRRDFSGKFRKIYHKNNKKPFKAMSGTMDSFWERFSILDKKSFFWFSSYLFLMTGDLKKEFSNLSLSEDNLNAMVTMSSEGEIIWGNTLSPNLKSHLVLWMNPTEQGKGWYNKGVDNSIKLRKLKAILNEKYLTSNSRNLGGIMYEVKLQKRVKYLLWNVFSKLKEMANEVRE